MAKPHANLRLFVAAYPPMRLVERWCEALSRLSLPAHRMVPREQVHLTLQFIGDTPVTELDDVIESVRRATGGLGSFELTPTELICLPEKGPSRLVALETNAPPTLLELQHRLAIRLARNVRKRPGKGFRPHFTLCRFRSPTRLGVKWPTDKAALKHNPPESFTVTRLHLMRSTLRPQGAEHVEVAEFELEQ